MKLIWLTDIHLNFLEKVARHEFYKAMKDTECDALLISGDIAEAESLEFYLTEMADAIGKPIYFVLGNHDYYAEEGSVPVESVRTVMKDLTRAHDKLYWLPSAGIKQLDEDTILLGQDGWADGRLGDYANTTVCLNDSTMIADLADASEHGRESLLLKMQQLADADAKQLKKDLKEALKKNPKKIIILTHVPPFKEACMYKGKQTDDNWLPYFTSKATGDVLMLFAKLNPHIEFLTLSGHTHHPAEYQPMLNLIVKAGKAEYEHPSFQDAIILQGGTQKLEM